MALIGRAEVGPPPGQAALEAVPDMELLFEDIRSLEDEPWRMIIWATGDDFERYERALTADPEIDTYDCLTELPDARLYRLELSAEGQRKTLHSVSVEEDITIIRLTATAEREELLARFPTRDAVVQLRDGSLERDREFTLLNLYEEEQVDGTIGFESKYGTTTAQREALLTALEKGYFDEPRKATLATVAEELGISKTALSERLRRGQKELLLNTLARQHSQ
ncbi:helix-turn-helix domain-containing protein [Natronobeatus ordinarius]|uniref:helix-turn-helix domain-containing protein n=1 Tax=Natronobeatus ordinarius TaxID=2963433 RepID=UPI0020CE8D77|nr:helix-turn-helix domain-containing protein [Natronobeatus ordinarius]